MKSVTILIAIGITLAGCSQDDADAPAATANPGMFTGTVGETDYKVEVRCEHFDQDYFMFNSDLTDASDSNGDGIVISGMQTRGKFIFTVIDNGKTYSVGRLASFSKGDNQAEGSGTVHEDGSTNSYDARFLVTCG